MVFRTIHDRLVVTQPSFGMSVPLVALFAHMGGLGKGSGAEVFVLHRARPRAQLKVWAKSAGKCLPRRGHGAVTEKGTRA
jgi:hypothetical protein